MRYSEVQWKRQQQSRSEELWVVCVCVYMQKMEQRYWWEKRDKKKRIN